MGKKERMIRQRELERNGERDQYTRIRRGMKSKKRETLERKVINNRIGCSL